MKDTRIIRTLKITGLFGLYNVSIEFNTLTVIVGKNGLGKTTLLKILKGFTTGNHEINYGGICDDIELTFNDGNIISFGIISDEMSRAVASKGLLNHIMHDEKGIESIITEVSGLNAVLSDEEKKDLADRLIKSAMSSEIFINMIRQGYNEILQKDKKQIFANKFHTEELKKNVAVRYLSTVNISANAGNSVDFGNSIRKNLLDIAIYDELRILLKKGNINAVDTFKKQLNLFLNESGKSAVLDHNDWMFITDEGVQLNLSQLSSGERQLAYILATAANTIGGPTLLLMDEPEVSLHLNWQEKILDAILEINPQMQIIAVTHSPGIIMHGHMDAYIEMKDIIQEIKNA